MTRASLALQTSVKNRPEAVLDIFRWIREMVIFMEKIFVICFVVFFFLIVFITVSRAFSIIRRRFYIIWIGTFRYSDLRFSAGASTVYA